MSQNIFNKVITDKQKWEHYVKLIRKSIIGYIINSLGSVWLLIIWGVLVYFLGVYIFFWDFAFHLSIFIPLVLYLVVILFYWWYFWYYTYLLITTHRIEKHRPTYLLWDFKEVLYYHEISKVAYFYPSIVSKLLWYGTLEMRAGWEKENIVFELVPKPEKVAEEIKQLVSDYIKANPTISAM